MLCWEQREISLSVQLANSGDITGRISTSECHAKQV